MCDPISLLGFGASAASSAVGFMGQQSQYEAQQEYYNQNKINAEHAFADTNGQISVQEEQQQSSEALQEQQNDLKTRAAQGTAIAGAAAGGVQGISTEEILGGFSMQDALSNSALREQTQWDLQQGQSEKTAAGDQEVGRINSVSPGVAPSPLASLLQIGQSGIQGMTNSMRGTQQNGGVGFGGFGVPAGFNFGNSLAIGGFH